MSVSKSFFVQQHLQFEELHQAPPSGNQFCNRLSTVLSAGSKKRWHWWYFSYYKCYWRDTLVAPYMPCIWLFKAEALGSHIGLGRISPNWFWIFEKN